MPLALFDLDNTLADRDRIFASWARETAERHAPGAAVAALATIHDLDGDGLVPRGDFLTRLRERLAIDEPVATLLAAYDATYLGRFRLDEGVAEALDRLRAAGCRLGVVTNGHASQRRKIAACGLEQLVDACVVSDEIGIRKPDPAIFQVAADRCGVPLSGAWMVGDRHDADIGGARAAGIRSVWIRRGRSWPAGLGFAPTASARTIAEAADVILRDG